MKYLAILLIFGFGLSGFGQTIKSLGYNTTNGQVVANTGTNVLTFTNANITFNNISLGGDGNNGTITSPASSAVIDFVNYELYGGWGFTDTNGVLFAGPLLFSGVTNAATTRANLGFSTNLNTLWTATNASNARSAVGLGWTALTNSNASVGLLGYQTNGIVQYAASGTTPLIFSNTLGNDSRIRLISQITDDQLNLSVNTISYNGSMGTSYIQLDELKFVASDNASWTFFGPISFNNTTNSAATRANLGFSTNLNTLWTATNISDARSAIGLGTTSAVTFSNVVNNGSFTNNNGTIYGLKTNVGPFEGIGNFFASNNTTVGNETLFRVGVAETTNKSAQFGFRIARTNNGGEGLAVFSVFGYNALMMIGPSDRSRSNSLTNTNAAIEADIWTMSETNRVMTLRDTNTGATVMHRPIGFNTNEVSTTAPSNTTVTNPTGWIQIYVGTNSVRVPYYQ